MKVFPPTVIVPVLSGPVFAATVKVTVPFPLPVPELIVIHDSLVVAVQAHPVVVVTVKLPFPPAAAKFPLTEDKL